MTWYLADVNIIGKQEFVLRDVRRAVITSSAVLIVRDISSPHPNLEAALGERATIIMKAESEYMSNDHAAWPVSEKAPALSI